MQIVAHKLNDYDRYLVRINMHRVYNSNKVLLILVEDEGDLLEKLLHVEWSFTFMKILNVIAFNLHDHYN